jgi:hypothetical protein
MMPDPEKNIHVSDNLSELTWAGNKSHSTERAGTYREERLFG